MAVFTCLDCGNQSSKTFPAGKCPACGSFKIKSPASGLNKEGPKNKNKTKKEIFLMLLLWGFIAFEAIRRYW